MSTTPFPGPYPTTMAHVLAHHATTPGKSKRVKPALQVLRRRPTPQQGHSLEMLGHAIEYLVDSRLYLDPGATSRADGEASQILMRASREVFADCREIISTRRRLKLRLLHLFATGRTA